MKESTIRQFKREEFADGTLCQIFKPTDVCSQVVTVEYDWRKDFEIVNAIPLLDGYLELPNPAQNGNSKMTSHAIH